MASFPMTVCVPLVLALFSASPTPCAGNGRLFLGFSNSSNASIGVASSVQVESLGIWRDLRDAMHASMGCGLAKSVPSHEGLMEVRLRLLQSWHALPKNNKGRIDRSTVHDVVRRYFMRRYGLVIRGFESSRAVNSSMLLEKSSDGSLRQQIAGVLETAFHSPEEGISLSELVYIVVSLDEFVSQADAHLLELVSTPREFAPGRNLEVDVDGLGEVLTAYLARWLYRMDESMIHHFLGNHTWQAETPYWNDLVILAAGQMMTFEHFRERQRQVGRALRVVFSFEDALEIVNSITRSFSAWWESECAAMRNALIVLDLRNSGRVPISKFYKASLTSGGRLRFSESLDYLRALGALDESSRIRGTEVIIPNYLEAMSNCAISTDHYHICCSSTCEAILVELESWLRAPAATPAAIQSALQQITATHDDEDEPPRFGSRLLRQLEEVATKHGGKVPIHSRLFRQWLHFAFPRDCPFPHISGKTVLLTPQDYGRHGVVSTEQLALLADDPLQEYAARLFANDTLETLEWMSQWSHEEELLSPHIATEASSPPTVQPRTLTVGATLASMLASLSMALAVLTFALVMKRSCYLGGSATPGGGSWPATKAVFV